MDKLVKDCPFCGSKAHHREQLSDEKGTTPDCVICLECWAEMEGDGTPDAALEKWNKRVQS